MSDFGTFIAALDDKGRAFAADCRSRLRVSYMAAKAHGKFQDWTAENDRAFDLIDEMVLGLTLNAGYAVKPQQLKRADGTFAEREEYRGAVDKLVGADAERAKYPTPPAFPVPPMPSVNQRPKVDAESLARAISKD